MRTALFSLLLLVVGWAMPTASELAERYAFIKDFIAIPAQERAIKDWESGTRRYIRFGADLWQIYGYDPRINYNRRGVCAPDYPLEEVVSAASEYAAICSLSLEDPPVPIDCSKFTIEMRQLEDAMHRYVGEYNEFMTLAGIDGGDSACKPNEDWDGFFEWFASQEDDLGIRPEFDGAGVLSFLMSHPQEDSKRDEHFGMLCAQLAGHGIKRPIALVSRRKTETPITTPYSLLYQRWRCSQGKLFKHE